MKFSIPTILTLVLVLVLVQDKAQAQIIPSVTCETSGLCWCWSPTLQGGFFNGYCVHSAKDCVMAALGVDSLHCGPNLILNTSNSPISPISPTSLPIITNDITTPVGCIANQFCWCHAPNSPDVSSGSNVGYCTPTKESCLQAAFGVRNVQCSTSTSFSSESVSRDLIISESASETNKTQSQIQHQPQTQFPVIFNDLSTEKGCDKQGFCWCNAEGSVDQGTSVAYCVPNEQVCLSSAVNVRGVHCGTTQKRNCSNNNYGVCLCSYTGWDQKVKQACYFSFYCALLPGSTCTF